MRRATPARLRAIRPLNGRFAAWRTKRNGVNRKKEARGGRGMTDSTGRCKKATSESTSTQRFAVDTSCLRVRARRLCKRQPKDRQSQTRKFESRRGKRNKVLEHRSRRSTGSGITRARAARRVERESFLNPEDLGNASRDAGGACAAPFAQNTGRARAQNRARASANARRNTRPERER